jgi:hypothetical protein
VASITAEMSGAFPPAGNLALAVVSTVVVASMGAAASMAVVVDTGKRMYPCMDVVEKFKE